MSEKYIDINGFKEITDNPLSCVGVYPYMGSSIRLDPPDPSINPNAIYYVYRPEEELSNPECLESFKLIPWVDDHTMLGDGATPAEEKGVQGVIGESVYYKDGTIFGNIKIFGSMLASLIQAGKKELSCGYRCTYEKASGFFNGQAYQYVQRNIRGNHLALVDEGRMGASVAVQDCNLFTFTIDSKELKMADEENTKEEGGAEGNEVEMTLAEITAFLKKAAPLLQELEKAKSAVNSEASSEADPSSEATDEDEEKKDDKKADGMDSKIKSLESQLAALKSDATKTVMSEIAARNDLYNSLSHHTGAFDHAEMGVLDVAKYGVKKLGIACDSGQEIAAIKGFLHGRKPVTFTKAQDSKATEASATVDAYFGSAQ